MVRMILAGLLLTAAMRAPAAPLRGDANADGAIEMLDIFSVISAVHADAAYTCRSDADSDRAVTSLDADFLVSMQLRGGPAPVQASETCNGYDDNCDGTLDEGVNGCFVAAFGQAPSPAQDDSAYDTEIRALDAYLLLDRSGSMTGEVAAVRNNMVTVANNVRCPPLGVGAPGQCIEDLWLGAGTIGYRLSSADAYRNHLDLQLSPNFSTVPTSEPGGCCDEAFHQALYFTITGSGSATLACGVNGVAARTSCAGSPAANAGIATTGYPCFRKTAVKFAFLFTDEAPSANSPCPSAQTVVIPQAISIGLRIAGLVGTGAASSVWNDLRTLATGTGAVDSSNGPLVFNASDSAASGALQNALITIASGIPMNIRATVRDDPADAVDTVAAFVDHIEAFAPGTAECTNTFTMFDEDGNGFPETYRSAITGTPLCWRLVLKQNNSIPPTAQPQMFSATVQIGGETEHVLYERPISFVVPR